MPTPFTGNEEQLLRTGHLPEPACHELLERIADADQQLTQLDAVMTAAGMLARPLAASYQLGVAEWMILATDLLRVLPKEHRWFQWRDFAECALHRRQFRYQDGCPVCATEA